MKKINATDTKKWLDECYPNSALTKQPFVSSLRLAIKTTHRVSNQWKLLQICIVASIFYGSDPSELLLLSDLKKKVHLKEIRFSL